MALRLIIEDEEGATTIVPLGEEEVTIGREPGNTIQLTEQNVSRQHARLTQGSDGWVIEDLDSYNGVKVNGVLVEGSVTLNEGDVVQIGDYHLALSNNVEQTTLNIDRKDPAANEPIRGTPSVDLPRISASEAVAIATPPYTPPYSGAREDERERESEGGGRGLLIGLGVVAVLGLGFFAFKMMGSGDPAPKKNDPPVTAPNEVKMPTKSTQDPPPDPVPPTPPPDPTAAPTTVAPDPSAGDTPPEVVDDPPPETKKPRPPETKATPKPPPEVKKKPDVPKGDPVQLLEDARKALIANNATQAYELARKSYEIDRNGAALKLMGVSACKMGDPTKAKSAYKKLDASVQKQLQSVCADKGITLGE